MKIVWDEHKRQINRAKHGMDFANLTEDFFADAITIPAKGGRWKAIGRLADGTVAVIYAALGDEAVSVISMRPASRDERRLIL